jgi:hypothetical protein
VTDVWDRLGQINDILTGKPVVADYIDQSTPTFPEPTEVTPPAEATKFTNVALAQAGDAYVWGAGRGLEDDPSAFDCSGLVYYSARKLGVKVGGTAYDQWKQAKAMSVEDALRTPGALLFSGDGTGTNRNAITHVAISLGDGRTIEARGSRYGVMVVDADTNRRRFNFAGTIPGLAGSAQQTTTTVPQGQSSGKYALPDRLAAIQAIITGRPTPKTVSSPTEQAVPEGTTAPNPAARGDYQTYAQAQLAHYGWDDTQWAALDELWGHDESGWNPTAQNPKSTAYGIAQFLDGTWQGVGYRKTSDPYVQIEAGLAYIRQRYGSPAAALAFHRKHGWY